MNNIAEFIKANKMAILVAFAVAMVLVMVVMLEGGEKPKGNMAVKATPKPERMEQTIAPTVSASASPILASALPQSPKSTSMPVSAPLATAMPKRATPTPKTEEEENVEEVAEAETAEQEVRKPESIAKETKDTGESYSLGGDAAKAVEATPEPVDDGEYCTIAIYADTLLRNMDLLDRDKHGLVPQNGCILPATRVELKGGENVFDILQKATRENKIHMEFVKTPIYNSAYIEGINNLYEFDAGELSGWMYSVNKEFPNYGCSGYKVKSGDAIEWHYTCDIGVDISGRVISQRDE